MGQIKNIIWDWNGTIVNDAFLFVEIMNGVLKKEGLPLISLEDYKNNFCFPITQFWKSLGFVFNRTSFDILNAQFIDNYKKQMFRPKLHKGIIDLFKYIEKKNIHQFVLSASEHSLLKKSVSFYGVKSFFKAIRGVDNVNALGKEFLGRRLCLEYQLNPQNTLLIGDTEHDVDVSVSIQTQVLLVAFGHISKNRLLATKQSVVDSIEEIKSFI